MEINFWAATDSGRVREHNEDRFLVNRRLNLFMVCDGMGGHAAGEVASEKATQVVHEILAENHGILARYTQQPDPAVRKDVLTLLEFAVRDACTTIYEMAQAESKQRGMGTTCSLMLLCGRRGFVAHVGDSRVYLLRGEKLHQLTEDHTVHNELKKRGRLTDEEVADMPFKNAVTRAVGIYETVDVDTLDFDILPGDRFLLCSDGLHGYFEGNNLLSLLSNPKPEAIPKNCIEFANRKGGSDNITVVIVALGDEDEDLRALQVQHKLEVIGNLDIFQFLDYKELSRILPIMQRLELRTGETLIEADHADEAMYVVLDGAIEVFKATAGRVGRLGPGQTFGLFSLIDVHPKRTRYLAERDATVLRLPRDAFYELMRQDTTLAVKLLWNMLQVLGRRSADYLPELELDPRSFSDGISGIWNMNQISRGRSSPQPAPEPKNPRSDDAIALSPEEFEDLIEDDHVHVLDSMEIEMIEDEVEPTGTFSRIDIEGLDDDDDSESTQTRKRRPADTLIDTEGPPPPRDKFARLRSMIERQNASKAKRSKPVRNLGKVRPGSPGRFRPRESDKTVITSSPFEDNDSS